MIFKNLGKIRKIKRRKNRKIKISIKNSGRILNLFNNSLHKKNVIHYFIVIK